MALDFTKLIRRTTGEPVARFTVRHTVTVNDLCYTACRAAGATCVNSWDAEDPLPPGTEEHLPKSKSAMEEEIRSTYAAFGSEDASGDIPLKAAWGIMSDRIESWYGIRPHDWGYEGI